MQCPTCLQSSQMQLVFYEVVLYMSVRFFVNLDQTSLEAKIGSEAAEDCKSVVDAMMRK